MEPAPDPARHRPLKQLPDDPVTLIGLDGITNPQNLGMIIRSVAASPVDGLLLLDKPTGMTSNGALQRVKRLFNARKAGHTGSLDPLASGLLPICLGQATKLSAFLLDAQKTYVVRAQMGAVTVREVAGWP